MDRRIYMFRKEFQVGSGGANRNRREGRREEVSE
jgi:hypothetical protein